MKAVVLEDYAIQQGDLDWSGVKALVPDITRYGRTAQEEVVPRIGNAEIVFLNKCRIDEAVLAQCPEGMEPERFCICLAVFLETGLLSSPVGSVYGAREAQIEGKADLESTEIIRLLRAC